MGEPEAVDLSLCVFTLHREGSPHKSRLKDEHLVFVGKLRRIDEAIGKVEIRTTRTVLEERAEVQVALLCLCRRGVIKS